MRIVLSCMVLLLGIPCAYPAASGLLSRQVIVPIETPAISALSPTLGPVGTTISVTGVNFGATQENSMITVNGTVATASSWTNTAITFTIPSGATTGAIVITRGGRQSNGVAFTVTASPDYYTGTTRTAASCSRADVLTKYNEASDLDIIDVPAGDCNTTNNWTSYLTVSKKVMFRGAGGSNTKIRGGAFDMRSGNVRITGFEFDCDFDTEARFGIVRWGSSGGQPTWDYRSNRIDHNTFIDCGAAGGDTTGKAAITLNGIIEIVIDHNTFNNCNGECIDDCSDATYGLARSNAFGGSGQGWVFIEDNTFNANQAVLYENITDGNSGERKVIRYNTINLTNGAEYASEIVSGHETCANCMGDVGDAGSQVMEMYENTINLGTTGIMRGLMTCRGGHCVIYNNNVTYSGSTGRWGVGGASGGALFSNYRSQYYAGGVTCGPQAANQRGYSEHCHAVDSVNPALTREGREANKTTLNGGITSGATSLTLTSVTGINTAGDTNGFAIEIDTEVICYASISGSTLNGLTRGCANTTAAAHSDGANVSYHTMGICLEQPYDSYIFNNKLNGSVGSDLNSGGVTDANDTNSTDKTWDFSLLDVKSFAQRPANWQFKEGSVTYTPYTYPHPLQSTTGPG